MVTKQLSAVMRSILESCRTLGVWLTSLVLYYAFHDDKAGERWTGWSFLELLGFALLVYTERSPTRSSYPCRSRGTGTSSL